MVAFNGTLNPILFQECLQYIQDTLDWLLNQEEHGLSSLTSPTTHTLLGDTSTTLNTILYQKVLYLQNASAHINRLPPEVLGRILLCLKDPFVPIPAPETPSKNVPAGLWHRASLVCRHWRWIVLNTPQLWSTIKISEALNRYTSDPWPWSTVGLSRSGAVPLSVRFHVVFSPWLPNRDDIASIFSQSSRIVDLRFPDYGELDTVNSLLAQSPNLKTLVVGKRTLNDSELDQSHFNTTSCELPQLRLLSVTRCQGWRAWSLSHELRHLSLAYQTWSSDAVHDLLILLETNPRLEELMLLGITIQGTHVDAVKTLCVRTSPIHMPKLQRLLVRDSQLSTPFPAYSMAIILSKLLVLPHSCVRCFILPDSWEAHDGLGARETLLVPRLLVGAGKLVGTDGILCLAVQVPDPSEFLIHSVDCAQIRELWLSNRRRSSYDPDMEISIDITIMGILRSMDSVTKLVLTRDVSFWLEGLGDSFPALKRLEVDYFDNRDGQPILKFLLKRKQNGSQLSMLRFVGQSTDDVFRSWKRSSWKFARQVDSVIFEVRRARQSDTLLGFEEFMPRRMKLPEICNVLSPLSDIWLPWRYMSASVHRARRFEQIL